MCPMNGIPPPANIKEYAESYSQVSIQPFYKVYDLSILLWRNRRA
jgi:hypothetical protein